MLPIKAISLVLLTLNFAIPMPGCGIETTMVFFFLSLNSIILPILHDPILIRNNLNISTANGFIHLTDVKLHGLRMIDLIENHYDEIGEFYKIGLQFMNNISVTYKYDVDLQFPENFHVYGDGDVVTTISNFETTLDAKLEIVDEKHKVKDVALSFDLDDFKFQVTGLNNDDKFSKETSQIITKILPEFLRNNNDLITNLLKPSLLPLLTRIDDICVNIIH